jgi:hypothetical protein
MVQSGTLLLPAFSCPAMSGYKPVVSCRQVLEHGQHSVVLRILGRWDNMVTRRRYPALGEKNCLQPCFGNLLSLEN